MRRGRVRLAVLVVIALVVGATTAVGGSVATAPPAQADLPPILVPYVPTLVPAVSGAFLGDSGSACAGSSSSPGPIHDEIDESERDSGSNYPGHYVWLPLAGGDVTITVTGSLVANTSAVVGAWGMSLQAADGSAVTYDSVHSDLWGTGWFYIGDSNDQNVTATRTFSGLPAGLYRLATGGWSYGAPPGDHFHAKFDASVSVSGTATCADLASLVSLGGAPDVSGKAADPVNTATGNFEHTERVVGYPSSVFGMDLDLTYNSLGMSGSVLGTGIGWTSSLDTSLTTDANGNFIYRDPKGRQVALVSAGTDAWTAPEGMYASIVRLSSPTRYAIQFVSGQRWEFDASGRLVTKCEGNPSWTATGSSCGGSGSGQTVTVDWSALSGTKPASVTSSNGMVLQLAWDTTARHVTSITAKDDANSAHDRLVGFGYTTSGSVTTLSALTAPRFASDTGYPLSTFERDPTIPFRLAKFAVTAADGSGNPDAAQKVRVVDNTYDISGRVTAQTQAAGDKTTFGWDDPNHKVTVKWFPTACDGSCQSTCSVSAGCEYAIYVHDANRRLTTLTDTRGKDTNRAWTQPGTTGYVKGAGSTSNQDRVGAKQGIAYDGYGRMVQKVTADPATGYIPADSTSDSCHRDQTTGAYPAAGTSGCTGKAYTIESFAYDSSSRLTSQTNGAGELTTYVYNAGNTSAVPDQIRTGDNTDDATNAPTVVTTLEHTGNLITSRTSGGSKTCMLYDTAGRVTVETPNVVGACPTASSATSTDSTYGALGQLESVARPKPDASGKATWSYAYYGWGPLKSQTDPTSNNHPTTYTYYPTGEPKTVTDPLGKTTTTAITRDITDTGTCGTGVATPCRTVVRCGPGVAPCDTTAVTNVANDATVDVYDTADHRVRSIAAGGAETTYTYGPLGRLTQVTAPPADTSTSGARLVTKYSYDDAGRVTGVQAGSNDSAAGVVESTQFDKRGRATTRTSRQADSATVVTTSYTYDAADRVATTTVGTGSDAKTTTTTYFKTGAVKETQLNRPDYWPGTIPESHRFRYDNAGRQVAAVDRMAYNPYASTETAATSKTTYDAATGQPDKTYTPLPGSWDCTASGATCAVTATQYHGTGSVKATKTPDQYAAHPAFDSDLFQTSYAYDAAGRTTAVTTPNPAYTTVASPPSGTPTTVGSTTCYNDRGDRVAVIDPGGATVYGYTDSGRLADVWDPTGTTGTTCATVAVVSGNKGHVRYVYDGRGNRLERHAWDDATPTRNELVEHWTYTLDDRPAVSTDAAGRPTTTSYTLTAGRLTSKATQTGDVTDIDGAGNASSSKRVTTEDYLPNGAVGTVTARAYDASNNVTGTIAVGYSYDTVGRRKQVIANPGASQTVNTFTYNTRDQVTSLAYQNGTSASYSWNLGGLQTNATYPNGAYWRFLYDPAGRVQEVDLAAFATWNPVATYTYTAGGRPSTASLAGTAGSRTYTVDPSTGATTRMLQTVAGTTTNFDMAFDNEGRLALDCRYTHTAPCAPATDKPVTYGYDAASQLTTATVANPAVGDVKAWGYTYGNRGNRATATVTTKTSGADTVATTAYTTDGTGQLTAAASTTGGDNATWRYDKAGRRLATVRTTGENQTLTYDPVGRLAGRVTSGGQWNGTETRAYDALGSLTNVSIANGSTNTVALAWDHSGRDSVPQVTVATYNGLNTQYSYGLDRITLQNYTGYWFNYDDLGSTIYKPVTAYTPNGAPTPASTNTDWHYFGYRAELTIANLVHLRNRDYDPTTATFTTRDPLDGVPGTTTTANPYHYSANDPVNKVDPLGLRQQDRDFDQPTPPDPAPPTPPDSQPACSERVRYELPRENDLEWLSQKVRDDKAAGKCVRVWWHEYWYRGGVSSQVYNYLTDDDFERYYQAYRHNVDQSHFQEGQPDQGSVLDGVKGLLKNKGLWMAGNLAVASICTVVPGNVACLAAGGTFLALQFTALALNGGGIEDYLYSAGMTAIMMIPSLGLSRGATVVGGETFSAGMVAAGFTRGQILATYFAANSAGFACGLVPQCSGPGLPK